MAHSQQMERKQSERVSFCQEIEVDANHAYKDWEANEHDVFCKIYRKAQVSGMKRSLLLDLLRTQLPTKTKDDILLHEEWYRKMKAIQGKYKEAEAIYKTQRVDLLSKARTALREHFASLRLAALNEKQLEEQEQRRARLQHRLGELRAQKEAALREQLQVLRARQLELTTLHEEEQHILELERAQKKELVRAYHQHKQETFKKQAKLQAEQEEAAAKAIKESVERNKPKVERRSLLYYEKLEQKKLAEEEVIKQEERRMELLQKLAQQASYWTAIQDIKSRLDQATTGSKGHEYIAVEAPARGHFPLQGFADQKVIKDARFRLVEALRMANLQHSTAARDAVLHFCPRPHLAIHGII
jgi:hypothetical protein